MAYTDESYWSSLSYNDTTNFGTVLKNSDDSVGKTITYEGTEYNDKFYGLSGSQFRKSQYDSNSQYDNGDLYINTYGGDDYIYISMDDSQSFQTLDLFIDMGDGDDAFYYDLSNSSGGSLESSLTIDMGADNDYVYWSPRDSHGDDTVTLGSGSDYFVYDSSFDSNITVYGDYDDDTSKDSSLDYDDIIITGDGNDTVEGGYGDDYISVGDGTDSVDGGEGNDIIVAGGINSDGIDTLTGGEGQDTFVINEWDTSTTSADNPFGINWSIWRATYTGADVISSFGSIAGVSNPVASLFMNTVLYNGANAFATWLTAANDSTVTIDASDETYSVITDFNMREDLVILPTLSGHSFSTSIGTQTIDGNTEKVIEFYYDGVTDTFLKIAIEGQTDQSGATGFFAEFLDAIGGSYSSITQDVLMADFAQIMVNSIAFIQEDDSGNLVMSQDGYDATYTDSDLDEYYDTDWSSILDSDTGILMMGSDTGYMTDFTASDVQFVAGGDMSDVFWGVAISGAIAYVATFDGDDLYYHKDAEYGFYYNGGDGSDTVSFENIEGTSGVTIDLSVEAQTDFAYYMDAYNNEYWTDASLVNVENVIGTAHSDYISGNNDANVFSGNGGNDTINGEYGYDTVYLDTKIQYYTLDSMDSITEDASGDVTTMDSIEFLQFEDRGSERYAYSSDTNTMSVYSVDSGTVDASGFSDWVYSGESGEKLRGRGDDDHFIGAGGDDTIYGDGQTWDSGNTDTAYYLNGVAGYLVDYVSDTYLETTVEDLDTVTHDEGTDTLYNVEILSFSDGVTIDLTDDLSFVIGTSSDESLEGGYSISADTIDWIFGGGGDDTIEGYDGSDHLIGGEGDDSIYGHSVGLSSVFTETAYYSDSVAGYMVTYVSDVKDETTVEDLITSDYDEGTDTLYDIDILSFGDGITIDLSSDTIVTGTDNGDDMSGSNNGDVSWLFGGDGNDTMNGFYYDDHFIGGTGDDNLYGVYGSLSDVDGAVNTAHYAGSIAEYLVDYVSSTDDETTIEDLNASDYDEGTDTAYNIEMLSFGDGVTIDLTSESIVSSSSSEDDNTLHGLDNDAWVFGGAGNDTLFGWKGDDDLIGGEGDDKLYGGSDWYNNSSDIDTAYYADTLDNYEISVWQDSSGHDWATIEDIGDDGYDEGFDTLEEIDYVVFAGTEYSMLDLAGMAA